MGFRRPARPRNARRNALGFSCPRHSAWWTAMERRGTLSHSETLTAKIMRCAEPRNISANVRKGGGIVLLRMKNGSVMRIRLLGPVDVMVDGEAAAGERPAAQGRAGHLGAARRRGRQHRPAGGRGLGRAPRRPRSGTRCRATCRTCATLLGSKDAIVAPAARLRAGPRRRRHRRAAGRAAAAAGRAGRRSGPRRAAPAGRAGAVARAAAGRRGRAGLAGGAGGAAGAALPSGSGGRCPRPGWPPGSMRSWSPSSSRWWPSTRWTSRSTRS